MQRRFYTPTGSRDLKLGLTPRETWGMFDTCPAASKSGIRDSDGIGSLSRCRVYSSTVCDLTGDGVRTGIVSNRSNIYVKRNFTSSRSDVLSRSRLGTVVDRSQIETLSVKTTKHAVKLFSCDV
ncbi:hypothetical protein F2P81_006126 [Scophthalmus maximus]|uniref:Uncharacterized protein n=1 Tax=Scophthalmus maximus TaxID=52904 RepID=A0A6A4TH77_SCOMX|nr:hypothetical protein F2P81_006126 [Scophthalmus maximus]